MKKIIFAIGLLGTTLLSAQEVGPIYVEDMYRINDNAALSGTARFRGMSGAMGALGGDISAARVNPAGLAVFLDSEATVSLGINTQTSDVMGNENSDTKFNLSQAGLAIVFDDTNSENWKNFALGINYERKSIVNEYLDVPELSLMDTGGNQFGGYRVENESYTDEVNINFGANYQDKLYFGFGMNFSHFNKDSYATYYENNLDGSRYRYIKNEFPNYKGGDGVSLTAGVIYRPITPLRLGLAYKSPTWWNDVLEDVSLYEMNTGTDDVGDYYYIDGFYGSYYHDMTSHHQVTGSAAYVFGPQGLLSADVTYKDYSPAKYKPTDVFRGENDYISDLNSTLSARIGAEFRVNQLRLRGGYRFEQSPFDENENYVPFGDLNGFSLGIGLDLNSFYADFAYDFYKRDRNYLIYGDHYDYGGYIDAGEVTDANEALDILFLNMEEQGLSTNIKDITEKQGNFTLTLGFRF